MHPRQHVAVACWAMKTGCPFIGVCLPSFFGKSGAGNPGININIFNQTITGRKYTIIRIHLFNLLPVTKRSNFYKSHYPLPTDISLLVFFEHIDLPYSLRSVDFPATPVTVIVEIILSGAGLKDSIPGYGPGEFVFEGAHWC